MSRYLNPPLTTVHVDSYRLGERAVERLLRSPGRRSKREPLREILPTTLVVRGSCGSLRAERARGGVVPSRRR